MPKWYSIKFDQLSGAHFIFHILLVCLSTVDRRSRERFIESNNQIASLVEKFKVEGASYRKFSGLNSAASQPDMIDNGLEGGGAHHQKVPLTAYGRPGAINVMINLMRYALGIH